MLGFDERFNRWTGRGWLDVRGAGWRIPMDAAYGATRAVLRHAVPDRPMQADWGDGRFPPAPFGLPGDAVSATAAVLVLGVAVGVAWVLGAGAGAAVVLASGLPLARLRDAVGASRDGLRAGPPWAPPIPWHELESVCYEPAGRGFRVWIRGSRHATQATLPAALLPAFRARVRRLGGLELEAARPTLDDRYASWLAPASGLPWGLLVGTGVATFVSSAPWLWLGAGLLCVAAAGLLGAAVEARATGWGAGAVLYASAVYAVVLTAVGLGLGGWLAP